jgi:DNA polymerase-3 subunit gamma/tau
VSDPELAAEAERDRLKALAAKFSAEDLMRAFEVLTKAEYEIRSSAYPRYHLEMALLRWIHLRRLVPISDLIQGLEKGGPGGPQRATGTGPSSRGTTAPRTVPSSMPVTAPRPAAPPQSAARDAALPSPAPPVEPPHNRPASPRPPSATAATVKAVEARQEIAKAAGSGEPLANVPPVPPAGLKDAFLDEIRKSNKFFYGTVIAQAQRIGVDGDRVVFTFGPQHRALRMQLEEKRGWLESLASKLSGRRTTVVSAEGAATASGPGAPGAAPEKDRQSELRQQALADTGVQAMLDVFAAEIKDVEEM